MSGLRLGAGFWFLGQIDRYGTAWLAVGVLILRQLHPQRLDKFLRMLKADRPHFEAMDHLLDHVDSRFHKDLASEDKVGELPIAAAAELRQELQRYGATYPQNLDLAANYRVSPAMLGE